jgi:hypothetical protein
VFGGTECPEAAAKPTRSVHTVLAAVLKQIEYSTKVQGCTLVVHINIYIESFFIDYFQNRFIIYSTIFYISFNSNLQLFFPRVDNAVSITFTVRFLPNTVSKWYLT